MKILFYDIETTPLRAWIWRLGDQTVRHDQLDIDHQMYKIICITYCWNDDKPAKALVWNQETHDSSDIVKKFDALIGNADFTLGKNSDKFDVKHINIQRVLSGFDGMPEWAKYTEDLEKQIRKHFALPSYSLDYLSKLLELGGKKKMELKDWIDIVTFYGKSCKALNKMVSYGKKDVEDTRALWTKLEKHLTPKWSMKAIKNDKEVCDHCGSKNLRKNGVRNLGKTMYQNWFCNEHGGHAGKTKLVR